MAAVTTQAGAEPEIATPSWEDIEAALGVVKELQDGGRAREAGAIFRLVQLELARQDAEFDDELTPEDVEALEQGEAGILAAKLIPHDIVMQGAESVEAFVRRRDAGDLPPEVAAAVGAFRRHGAARAKDLVGNFATESVVSEVLASRRELTRKHIDVPELMSVVDFTPLDDPVLKPEPSGVEGVSAYRTGCAYFAVQRIDLSGPANGASITPDAAGPRIVACVDGSVLVAAAESVVALPPGHSAFVSGSEPPCTLTGSGTAFVVSAP